MDPIPHDFNRARRDLFPCEEGLDELVPQQLHEADRIGVRDGTSAVTFDRQARMASLLLALVPGAASLGIGMLALGETYVLAAIQKVVGTSSGAATLVVGAGIVFLLCLVLVVLQYWCTRTAATFAFRWGKHA